MKRLRLDGLIKQKQGCSWGQARDWIETGKIFIEGEAVRDISFPVDEETIFELRMNAPKRSRDAHDAPFKTAAEGSGLGGTVLFEDAHLLVVDKQAGLSTIPYGKSEPDSLLTRLESQRRIRLRVVQRLDKETSGVLVFAKTPEAEKKLAQQFRFHTLERVYLAVAQGTPRTQTHRSILIPDRGDGLRGSLRPGVRAPREEQKNAITHVSVLRELGDSTWISCRLETGRTHQIRIHLSEAGCPLVGEKLYIRDFPEPLLKAPRTLLHAALLSISHPAHENRRCTWSAPLPSDFHAFLEERLPASAIQSTLSSAF